MIVDEIIEDNKQQHSPDPKAQTEQRMGPGRRRTQLLLLIRGLGKKNLRRIFSRVFQKERQVKEKIRQRTSH